MEKAVEAVTLFVVVVILTVWIWGLPPTMDEIGALMGKAIGITALFCIGMWYKPDDTPKENIPK